jgi:DNA-binding MarR family transcriptional regulator
LKPEPPADLWAQMDELHAKLGMPKIVPKTAQNFGASDYSERYGVTISRARDRIKKLETAGHVERIGMTAEQEIVYRFTK